MATPPLLTVAEVAPTCAPPMLIVAKPVPVNATVCGLLAALSVMLSVPVRAPVADGVNTTAMLQVLSVGRLDPQVLVYEKSPTTVMPEIARFELPKLVRAMVWTLLAIFCAMFPKLNADVESVAIGLTGTMVRLADAELPPPGAGL